MKILISHAYFLAEDPVEQKIMMPYPPLGILCISAFLEQNGIAHEVFDTTFSDKKTLYAHLSNKRPDILAIYVNLMTKLNVLEMIHHIRKNKDYDHIKIVLGGPETRYNAENYLQNGADVLVIGEGEITFFELIKTLEQGSALENVNGLAFKDTLNTVVFTPPRKLIESEEIPQPARHGIDMNAYVSAWKNHHGYSSANINSMRGCPYSCKWCSKAVFGNVTRRRSALSVVAEMKQLRDIYGTERIWFTDDVFTLQTSWLETFVEAIADQDLRIPYKIITRADCLDEKSISLLKNSGCYRVWVGAESGSDKILNAMDRRTHAEQVRKAIRLLQKAGIEAGTFIMLGYPGETIKDIRQTIRHLKACLPVLFTITLTYAVKGTVLWQELEHRLILDRPWENISDRNVDFERTYPKWFYKLAIIWVYNEVNYSAAFRKNLFNPKWAICKGKSILAKTVMLFAREKVTSVE